MTRRTVSRVGGEWSLFLRSFRLLLCGAGGMALAGCAPATVGTGPNCTPLPSNMIKIGVLTPDIIAFDVSSGGVSEYRVDWSMNCNSALTGYFVRELAHYGFIGVPIADSLNDTEFRRLRDNLRLHCEVIAKYLYGKHAFLPQIEKFDYSIGNITPFCERFGVDAVLFVFGFDERFSDERRRTLQKAANVKVARGMFIKTILFLLTGTISLSAPEYHLPMERTYLCGIAASSEGPIVWYNRKSAVDNADLSESSKLGDYLDMFFTIRRKK